MTGGPLDQRIGQNIRKARAVRNLSAEKLADLVCVSATALIWEAGCVSAAAESLIGISR